MSQSSGAEKLNKPISGKSVVNDDSQSRTIVGAENSFITSRLPTGKLRYGVTPIS